MISGRLRPSRQLGGVHSICARHIATRPEAKQFLPLVGDGADRC
jgi:hypothetical protein